MRLPEGWCPRACAQPSPRCAPRTRRAAGPALPPALPCPRCLVQRSILFVADRLYIVHCNWSSHLGPVDPSLRALSGRLTFTVRRHQFNEGSLSLEGHLGPGGDVLGVGGRVGAGECARARCFAIAAGARLHPCVVVWGLGSIVQRFPPPSPTPPAPPYPLPDTPTNFQASTFSTWRSRIPSSVSVYSSSSSSLLLSSLELSDTKVYGPQIRALLGTASHFCEIAVLNVRTLPIGKALSLRTLRSV